MTGIDDCVSLDHFAVVDGAITPRSYMTYRHVATNLASGVNRNYPPSGPAINDVLHTVQAQWTNDSPIPQKVYAMLTRGGAHVVLMARSRAYLETSFGVAVGAAPADPATSTTLGRFGIGFDGGAPSSGGAARYTVLETRSGERTIPIGDHVTVPAGHTFKARAALAFVSENWESVPTFQGGDIEKEARIASGATRLDLFAYPSL